MIKLEIFNIDTFNDDLYVIEKEGDQFKLQVDTLGGGFLFTVLGYFSNQDDLKKYLSDIEKKAKTFFKRVA